MAHDRENKEKIVYVGDSRVRKRDASARIPKDYSAYPGKSEAFIPNFLLKEWMVGVVVLVGFLTLTIAEPAPLGYPADPTNTSFIPMPDWYFLFLYEFLKQPYVSGDYVLLGTIGIPGIAFGAFLLAPFLDRGPERRFYRRPIASSLMLVSLAAMTYLTWSAWDHYQKELEANGIVPEHIERRIKAEEAIKAGRPRPIPGRDKLPAIVAADDPAFTNIVQAQCVSCHGAELEGGSAAPALRGIGDKLSQEEIADIITNGSASGAMPAFKDYLSAEEIDQVAAWLAKQKADAAE